MQDDTLLCGSDYGIQLKSLIGAIRSVCESHSNVNSKDFPLTAQCIATLNRDLETWSQLSLSIIFNNIEQIVARPPKEVGSYIFFSSKKEHVFFDSLKLIVEQWQGKLSSIKGYEKKLISERDASMQQMLVKEETSSGMDVIRAEMAELKAANAMLGIEIKDARKVADDAKERGNEAVSEIKAVLLQKQREYELFFEKVRKALEVDKIDLNKSPATLELLRPYLLKNQPENSSNFVVEPPKKSTFFHPVGQQSCSEHKRLRLILSIQKCNVMTELFNQLATCQIETDKKFLQLLVHMIFLNRETKTSDIFNEFKIQVARYPSNTELTNQLDQVISKICGLEKDDSNKNESSELPLYEQTGNIFEIYRNTDVLKDDVEAINYFKALSRYHEFKHPDGRKEIKANKNYGVEPKNECVAKFHNTMEELSNSATVGL